MEGNRRSPNWRSPLDPNRRPPLDPNRRPPEDSNRRPPGDPNQRPPGDPNWRPPGDPNWRPPGDPNRRPPGDPNRRPPGDPNRRPPGDPNWRPPGDPNQRPPGDPNWRPPGDPNRRPPGESRQHQMGWSARTPPGDREEEQSPPPPVERRIRWFEEALQHQYETIESFMSRLRTLANLAFPDESPRIRRRRVLWRFIFGIWDHDLSERLKEHGWMVHQPSGRPMMPDQLIQLARSIEQNRPDLKYGIFRNLPPEALMQYRATWGSQRARVRHGQAMPFAQIPNVLPGRSGGAASFGTQQREGDSGPTRSNTPGLPPPPARLGWYAAAHLPSGGLAQRPPAPSGSAQQPAPGGHVQQPAPGGSAQPHVTGGYAQCPPAPSRSAQLPVPGGSAQPPASGGHSQLPVPGGSSQLPAASGSAQLPVPGGSVQLTVPGGSSQVPVSWRPVQRPAPGGSAQRPPAPGGAAQLPVPGEHVQQPAPGGSAQLPAPSGSGQLPVPGEHVQQPAPGGSAQPPVTGGYAQRPPAPSGSAQLPVPGEHVQLPTPGGPAQRGGPGRPSVLRRSARLSAHGSAPSLTSGGPVRNSENGAGHGRGGAHGVSETVTSASGNQTQHGTATSGPTAASVLAPADPDAGAAVPDVVPPPQQCGAEQTYETISNSDTSSISIPLPDGDDADADVLGAAAPAPPAAVAGTARRHVSAPAAPQHPQGVAGQLWGSPRQQLQGPSQQVRPQSRRPSPGAGSGGGAARLWGSSPSARPAQAHKTRGEQYTLPSIERAIQEHVAETRREEQLRRDREADQRRRGSTRSVANPIRFQSPQGRSRSPISRPGTIRLGDSSRDSREQQLVVCGLSGSSQDLTASVSIPEKPVRSKRSCQSAGPFSEGQAAPKLPRNSTSGIRLTRSRSQIQGQASVPEASSSDPPPMVSSQTPQSSSQDPVKSNPPDEATGAVPKASTSVRPRGPAPASHHNPPPSQTQGHRPISQRPAGSSHPPEQFLFSGHSSLSSIGRAVGIPPLLSITSPQTLQSSSAPLSVDLGLASGRLPAPLSPLSPVSPGVMPPQQSPHASPRPVRPSPLATPPGQHHSTLQSSGPVPSRPSPLLHSPPSLNPPGPTPHHRASTQAPPPRLQTSAPSGSAPPQGASPPSESPELRGSSQSFSPVAPPDESSSNNSDRRRRRLTRAERNRRREQRLTRHCANKLKKITGNGKQQEGGAGAPPDHMDVWKDYRQEHDSD